jgi:hypothetical protein
MGSISVSLHMSRDDKIVIQRVKDTQWMGVGEFVVFASDADLARIRDEIDRHLMRARADAEAA